MIVSRLSRRYGRRARAAARQIIRLQHAGSSRLLRLLRAILFGSKFLVLEVVALVFGDRVSLGGYLLDKFGDEPGGAGRAVGLDFAVADGLADQFSDFGGDEVGFGGRVIHAMACAVSS